MNVRYRFKMNIERNKWKRLDALYFEGSRSPSPRVLIRVRTAFTELHTMRAAAAAKRKSSAREAHLTGALGHGRFDAGAKMTDKRRVASLIAYVAGKLCIAAFRRANRSNPADICEMSRLLSGFLEYAMNNHFLRAT